MKRITVKQIESLMFLIYESIMSNEEMGEARDEAKRIVEQWINDNQIETIK